MPQEDNDGNIMKGILTKMKSMEIAYFFGKISPDTDMVCVIFHLLVSQLICAIPLVSNAADVFCG